MKAQAKAAEMDARMSQLQAKQVAGARIGEVNDVISAVNLIRTGRRVGLDSETGRAIRRDRRRKGYEAKNAEVLGVLQKRDGQRARARNLKSQASIAPVLGFLNATADFSQAAKDAKSGGLFG